MTDYVLEILDGDRTGEIVPLGSEPLRIGRRPGSGLVIADEKVSGEHAELVAEGGGFVLRDLGSRNGTFLDDKRIEEVALSPGDTVRFGRIRLRFRGADDAPAADAGLEVTRLDTSARRRKGGSKSPIVLGALVVAVAGVGAWWQWGRGEEAGGGKGGTATPQAQVAGNLVPAGALEEVDGWSLDAGGDGFQPTSPGRTGAGAIVARPVAAEGAESSGLAVARLTQGLTVTAGSTLQVAASLRTAGGAEGAVRIWFSGDSDDAPSLRDGCALAQSAAWTDVGFATEVPTGCTRATVEFLALFAGADSAVWFDDLAVTNPGSSAANPAGGALRERTDSGPTLVAVGGGGAIRSVSDDDPFLVRRIDPLAAGREALSRARLLRFSDLGSRLNGKATGDTLAIEVVGGSATGLKLWLPSGSVSSLLVEREGGDFAPVDDSAAFRARRLLVGSGATRFELTLPEDGPVATGSAADRDYVELPGALRAEVRVGFQEERQRARTLLAEARQAWNGGRPGESLAVVDRLRAELPHDTEILGQALVLRGEMLDAARQRLDAMDTALQEAAFFRTEGGFQRVQSDLNQLVADYEPGEPPDGERVAALRARTETELARFASERAAANRKRLASLQAVFEAEGQSALAAMVKDYLKRYGAREDG